MYYDVLPIEIIHIIQEYSFAKCQNCNQIKQFDKLQHKIKIFKYKSIFDIDYDFPRFLNHYKLICNGCVKNYLYNEDCMICNYK
jgi:hypothetical protein